MYVYYNVLKQIEQKIFYLFVNNHVAHITLRQKAIKIQDGIVIILELQKY